MSFKDKWNKTQSENMAVKILESIKSQTPLKPRIEEAQKKLEMQITKLGSISGKIVEKDQLIFKRISTFNSESRCPICQAHYQMNFHKFAR